MLFAFQGLTYAKPCKMTLPTEGATLVPDLGLEGTYIHSTDVEGKEAMWNQPQPQACDTTRPCVQKSAEISSAALLWT